MQDGGASDIVMQTEDHHPNHAVQEEESEPNLNVKKDLKEEPLYLNEKDIIMDRNNDSVNATTSLPSSSSTAAVAAAEGMGEEQVQIYEELMMLINEQELPPLSNYIANELGAENESGFHRFHFIISPLMCGMIITD